jgi:hypothetical protein
MTSSPVPDRLSRRGLGVRVLATLLGAALLLGGTLWGSDDDFPFGPFSMFAGVNRLDDPAPDTRVEAVAADGTHLLLTERNTGIRRAEIEGEMDRMAADPALLGAVVRAYQERNPAAPPILSATVVIRWHELKGGEPTGVYRDEVKASWHA